MSAWSSTPRRERGGCTRSTRRASRCCAGISTCFGSVRWPPSNREHEMKEASTMIETVEAIRRDVVVDVDQARAFELFTKDMTSWWPSAHHIGSAPIEQIIVEPWVGGRWYTRHQDGSETSTGFVTLWEPPGRLVITWQIGADWKYHPDLVTSVEVRFEAVGDSR